jgi:MoxR-like ATPase
MPTSTDTAGHRLLQGVEESVHRRVVGQNETIQGLLIALLTGGHVLLEGLPGLAKTLLVRSLADALHTSFRRIQFTPDLLPGDVVGIPVYHQGTGEFRVYKGPIFANLLLADEVNRAPPKVQSALLEAMAEHQVTVGGVTRPLPDPFLVIATQNSIEHEGTFPLPEAQLDRFMMHVLLAYPDAAEERAILDLVEEEHRTRRPAGTPGLAPERLAEAGEAVRAIHLAPALKDYIVRLVSATRDPQIAPDVRAAIEHPVSPRGTLSLAAAARARAYLHGRDFAVPEDVAALAADVLSHRLVPTWRAVAEGTTARKLVTRLLEIVPPL